MNLKSRLKKIKASRGFTLVEVLVATLITFILVGSVMTLFTSVSGLVSSVNTSVFTQGLLENYAEYIRNTIDSSRCVVVTDEADFSNARTSILSTLGKASGNQEFHVLYIDDEYNLFDCTNTFTISATSLSSDFTVNSNDNVFNKEYYLDKIVPLKISTFTDDNGTVETSDDVEYKDAIQMIFHPQEKAINRKTTYRLPNLYTPDCVYISSSLKTPPASLSIDHTPPIYILYIPITAP